MNIIKNYSIAVLSSNLKDDALHHTTDILAAVALSGLLGSKLYRVKYCNDAASYSDLLNEWTKFVTKKSAVMNWSKESRPRKVAELSLKYYLNDVCEVCKGRGHIPHAGIDRVLSDEVCPSCAGTSKRKISAPHAIINHVKLMIESLESIEQKSTHKAKARL